MPRRRPFVFDRKPGRRDVFGEERSRYRNPVYQARKLTGRKQPNDLLDELVERPALEDATFMHEEPWMQEVTALLVGEFGHSDDMPGRKVLANIRNERLAQALSAGMLLKEAFVFAGFPVALPELLLDRELLHRIAYHRRVALEACGVTNERLVSELQSIAFARSTDAVAWDGNLVRLKSSEELDRDTQRAVSEVKAGQWGVGIKFHPKQPALAALMTMKGMLPNKVEMSGPNGKPIETNITADMDPRKAAEAYADLMKETS
jgi:hypothetical protein